MSNDLPELRRPDGSPLRILAVDDEQMLTDLLAMALRMEGWEVRTASSGMEALQVAREFEPDALVLDIMMPDLDGMAVLKRLREVRQPRAGALPHREGCRRRPRRRPHCRRRRLRHQALQPGRGDRAAARHHPPHRARHGRRRPVDPARRRPHASTRTATRSCATAPRSTSPPPSSSCSAT